MCVTVTQSVNVAVGTDLCTVTRIGEAVIVVVSVVFAGAVTSSVTVTMSRGWNLVESVERRGADDGVFEDCVEDCVSKALDGAVGGEARKGVDEGGREGGWTSRLDGAGELGCAPMGDARAVTARTWDSRKVGLVSHILGDSKCMTVKYECFESS